MVPDRTFAIYYIFILNNYYTINLYQLIIPASAPERRVEVGDPQLPG